MTSVRFHCEWAWLPGGVAADVLIEVVDGRFATITPGTPVGAAPDVVRLPGVTLPGFADAHSHAFHRALRGRTQGGKGTFWTWREQMYSVAGALDPDSYHRLATAVYAEMALAGITCVGEFHYLHHGPGGTPYADPNAMGEALIAAASAAGIRITLLNTLYLTSTVDGRPLEGVQRRFGDTGVEGWADRVARLTPGRTRRSAQLRTASGPSPPPRSASSRGTRRAGRRTCTSRSNAPKTTPALRCTAAPRRSCSPTAG
ncbi:hypothetical protein GCM10027610_107550 [Dactylosporangium cerinum]